MARYTVTSRKSGVNTVNTIMWQMRASSTDIIEIVELGLSVATAPNTSGPSWRLNRTTAIGTSTATVTPQLESPLTASAALARLDTTWSANPTLGGTDLRQYATPNAIGSGIVWTWYDRPLPVAVSTGIAVVNGNAPGTTVGSYDIYVIFDE